MMYMEHEVPSPYLDLLMDSHSITDNISEDLV